MTKAIFGIVKNLQLAEQLVSHLRSIGIPTTEIAILFTNKGQTPRTQERGEEASWRTAESRPQRQQTGGGSVPSGVLGSLPNITTITIPNFGTFIAAGKLLAALNSKKSGQDPLTAALQTLNVTDQEARRLVERLKGNNILIVAMTTEDPSPVRDTFEDHQATDIILSRELAGAGGKKSRS